MHHRYDAAHDHRELDQARILQLLGIERLVGGAERHGLGLDLLDAAAGTDRLVIESDAGLFLVYVRPLGIDRYGKVAPAPDMSAAHTAVAAVMAAANRAI